MIPSVVAAEVAGALRDFLATGFGPSNPALASVRLATMHRVKGLEFDRVVMASVNADLVPLPAALDARGDPWSANRRRRRSGRWCTWPRPARRRSC